jgi:hypothetical protein
MEAIANEIMIQCAMCAAIFCMLVLAAVSAARLVRQ